jgi:hypothetical protein
MTEYNSQVDQLDHHIETLMQSDDALHRARYSGDDALRLAAMLLSAQHPRLSMSTKRNIWLAIRLGQSSQHLTLSQARKDAIWQALRARQTAQRLKNMPAIVPSAARKDAIWQAIQDKRETAIQPDPQPASRPILRPLFKQRWIASIASALIVFFVGGFFTNSVSASLPGDTLYPVKRGAESVAHTINVVDADEKSFIRLREAERLVARGDFDFEVIREVVMNIEQQDDISDMIAYERLLNLLNHANHTQAVSALTLAQIHEELTARDHFQRHTASLR